MPEASQQKADRETLARVVSGDQRAFGELYDRLSGPLYSLAVRMLGDASEAQDALQDAFLQIWRRAATYDADQSSVFSWAVLLTRSKVIDRLRARGRRFRVVVSSTDDDDAQTQSADASTTESAADTADRNEAAGRDPFYPNCRRNSVKPSSSRSSTILPITKSPLSSGSRSGQSRRAFAGAC
jgi:RNA polymerase sigma factor (sigma-70 family)